MQDSAREVEVPDINLKFRFSVLWRFFFEKCIKYWLNIWNYKTCVIFAIVKIFVE